MAALPGVQRALEYNAVLAQCVDEALAVGDLVLAARYQRRLSGSLMLLLELAGEGWVSGEGEGEGEGGGGAGGAGAGRAERAEHAEPAGARDGVPAPPETPQ